MLRLAIEPDETEAPPRSGIGWLPMLRSLLGPRGARAGITALAVLALSLLVVSGVPTRLVAWVHDQPAYSWSVEAIALDPPPPPWFPGGRDAMIAVASRTLARSDGGSSLSVPLDSVSRAFKNLPWIDGVESVRRRYPDRITVRVRYHCPPVAIARLPGPGGPTDLVVDASGRFVAAVPPEADRDAFGPLIRLDGIEAPPLAEPGARWLVPDADAGTIGTPNPSALAASMLALWLLDDLDEHGPFQLPDGRPLRIEAIIPLGRENVLTLLGELSDPPSDDSSSGPAVEPSEEEIRRFQARTLYLLFALPNDSRFWVCWGNAPGSEEPGDEPTAPEKLTMLRDWLSRRDADAPFPKGSLVFTQGGAEWARPRP